MRTNRACVLVMVMSLVGCGAGGEVTPETTTRVEVSDDLLVRGGELYVANCVPCHGPGGRGDGPSAASLDPKPRDHTDPTLMGKLSDRRIAQTIQQGGIVSGFPNMPASPHIRGEELEALVAYVRSLHRAEVASVDLEGLGH